MKMDKIFENWKKFLKEEKLTEMTRYKKEGVILPSIIEELKKYQVKSGVPTNYYITFSNLPKLGINPGSFEYRTPLGIYAYPVTNLTVKQIESRKIPFAMNRDYIVLFKAEGNVLDSSLGEEEAKNYISLMKKNMKFDTWEVQIKEEFNPTRYAYVKTPLGYVWYTGWFLSNNSPLKTTRPIVIWNALFRSIGIDGVADHLGQKMIHEGEPYQAVFCSKKHLTLVKIFDNEYNPDLNKRKEKDYVKLLNQMFEKGIKPSIGLQLKAVKQDGFAVEYIKNPSVNVQLEAVKNHGWAIQYIENPSEKVQLEAVKNHGYAIEFIKNPSERVQIEAVKQNGYAIEFIKNPSEKVQIEAVKQNGYAVKHIKNPSVDIILFVCSQTNDLKLKGYYVNLLKEVKKEKGN